MIILVSLAFFVAGYLAGRWHERILWVYYDRSIRHDGSIYKGCRWDVEKQKWTGI